MDLKQNARCMRIIWWFFYACNYACSHLMRFFVCLFFCTVSKFFAFNLDPCNAAVSFDKYRSLTKSLNSIWGNYSRSPELVLYSLSFVWTWAAVAVEYLEVLTRIQDHDQLGDLQRVAYLGYICLILHIENNHLLEMKEFFRHKVFWHSNHPDSKT